MMPISQVDILLGTPLRLARLVRRKRVDLGAVRDLVCDEADQLLGAGLLAQLDRVLAACTRADKARCVPRVRVVHEAAVRLCSIAKLSCDGRRDCTCA
jgi:superfamily II DNA/RNA helicase